MEMLLRDTEALCLSRRECEVVDGEDDDGDDGGGAGDGNGDERDTAMKVRLEKGVSLHHRSSEWA